MLPQDEYKYIWYRCEKCGHRWYGPALDVSLNCPLDGDSLSIESAQQGVQLTAATPRKTGAKSKAVKAVKSRRN